MVVVSSFLLGSSFAYAAVPTLAVVGGSALVLPAYNAVDMAIVGTTIYALFNTSGTNVLRIIDASSPSSPSVIGGTTLSITEAPYAIAAMGNYVYLATFSGGHGYVRVINVTDPTNPVFVDGSAIDLGGGSVTDMKVSGNYLYMSATGFDDTQRFIIADIANPLAITVVGHTGSADDDTNDSFALVGNYAYLLLGGSSDAIEVIDVSDVANPAVVGATLHGLPTHNPNKIGTVVAMSSSYLAVQTPGTGTNTLRIVDITNPLAPVIVSGTGVNFPATPTSIAVSGTSLFIAGYNFDTPFLGVFVIDVTDPLVPALSSTPLSMFSPGIRMIVSNGYLYTANFYLDSTTNLVNIVSITNAPTGGGSSYRDTTPPDAPTKVTATASATAATLTWNDPVAPDLQRIEILRNDGGNTPIDGGNLRDAISPAIQKFIDTNVKTGETYQYQLRTKDTSGNVSLSEVISIVVAAPMVVAPSVSALSVAAPVIVVPAASVPVVTPAWSAKEEFLQHGSLATITFGSGERNVLWREFTELYGREPWVAELDLMSNGQIHERNAALEAKQQNDVMPIWSHTTGKKTLKGATLYEKAMYDTMVYRLRFPRDIIQEAKGLKSFISRMGRLPKTPTDWALVRALAYLK